jgi:phage terminase large subunit GpA-like protein
VLVAPFKSGDSVASSVAEMIRPRQRIRPSEAAARYLRTEKGEWSPDLVPYCLEPLDLLGSRRYQGIVFVGPARTGKTMGLILGGITYVVTSSPGDMLVVQMSQDAARDFSRMDLDRALRHSPELAARMSPRARDDNTFDKFFRSGVALKLGWPAVSQLSAKTLQYVFLTDYDRPENAHNVDGEGPMWGLAFKRTQTYMSRGKCLAESSPGEDQIDADWLQRSPHEAPPARGILSIYNTGTRARWYWPCLHCGEAFEAKPGLDCFAIPEFDELAERIGQQDLMTLAARWAKVVCPHCGGLHEPEDRSELNARGVWLHEGERLVDGKVEGERRQTQIASYWLGGVAAAYQTWPSILHEYLQAVQTYVRTGDESPLKRTVNTDQGAPYLPIAATRKRSAEDLVKRVEDLPRGAVPDECRFLTAAVDVQLSRFVVTVMAWSVGLESWIVDRFTISASARPEGDKYAGLEPAAFVEDWHVLIDQVCEKRYRTASGFELCPLLTLCDSGGREGVTDKAYEFWRVMKAKGLGKRFMLVKGVGNLNAPRVHQTWPDARARKDRQAGRGDVPVWLLNVNSIKDGVAGDLARPTPGPGYVHLPDWLPDAFFSEVTAEIRTPKGWVREGKTANEAFDLHTYNRAACIILKAEAINWNKPPLWAAPIAVRAQHAADKATTKRPPAPRRNWVKQW